MKRLNSHAPADSLIWVVCVPTSIFTADETLAAGRVKRIGAASESSIGVAQLLTLFLIGNVGQ